MSLTDSPDIRKTQYFPKFDWPRVLNPKLHPHPSEPQAKSPVGGREKKSNQEIEGAFKKYGDRIAAIILEPIQGEGGDNHFRTEFFKTLRKLADEKNVLLIFDEVQAGMGATGKWWAYEHHNVKPDILVFGKKSQVAGIAVTDRIDGVDHCFKISSRINSTFGGNLTDMVRATRYIEIIEQDKLLKNVSDRGEQMKKGLNDLSKKFPISNVRGLGGMVAFDFETGELRNKALKIAMEKERLVMLPSGKFSIRTRTSLSIQKDEITEGLNRLEKALKQL